MIDTKSEMKECHIFIAITNKVRSNKMIAMYRRTFIIKVLFFIFIPPFFLKIGGRHPHQLFLIELYIKWIYKTSEQEMFLIKFQKCMIYCYCTEMMVLT